MKRTPARTYGHGRKFLTPGLANWDAEFESPSLSAAKPGTSSSSLARQPGVQRKAAKGSNNEPEDDDIWEFNSDDDKKRRKVDDDSKQAPAKTKAGPVKQLRTQRKTATPAAASNAAEPVKADSSRSRESLASASADRKDVPTPTGRRKKPDAQGKNSSPADVQQSLASIGAASATRTSPRKRATQSTSKDKETALKVSAGASPDSVDKSQEISMILDAQAQSVPARRSSARKHVLPASSSTFIRATKEDVALPISPSKEASLAIHPGTVSMRDPEILVPAEPTTPKVSTADQRTISTPVNTHDKSGLIVAKAVASLAARPTSKAANTRSPLSKSATKSNGIQKQVPKPRKRDLPTKGNVEQAPAGSDTAEDVSPVRTRTPSPARGNESPRLLQMLTPPALRMSKVAPDSPRLSPQQRAVYDAFDKATSKIPAERPRRLMAALAQAKVDQVSLSKSESDRDSPFSSMVESAENNLQQQSQVETSTGDQLDEPESPSVVPAVEPQVTARSTYAKQRTYLAEQSHPDEILGDLTQPASMSSDSIEDDVSTSIRNVHDLRQGGETKRFIDDLEYLLEGLQKEKTLLATLFELCGKLISADFSRSFRALQYDMRTLSACKDAREPLVLACCMLVMMACRSHNANANKALQSTEAELVKKALVLTQDWSELCNDKHHKLSKLNQGAARDLRDALAKTDAFSGLASNLSISPRNLALMVCNLSNVSTSFAMANLWPLLSAVRSDSASFPLDAQLLLVNLESSAIEACEDFASSSLTLLMTISRHLLALPGDDQGAVALCCALRIIIHVVQLTPASTPSFDGELTQALTRLLMRTLPEADETDDLAVLSLGLLIALAEDTKTGQDHVLQTARKQSFSATSFLATRLKQKRVDAITGYLALLAYHLSEHTHAGAQTALIKSGLQILADSPASSGLLSDTLRSYLAVL